MPPIRVLLVRSDNVAWDGLRDAIERERRGDLHVAFEARDAAAALAVARDLGPDAVLMTAPIAGMPVLSFIAALRTACPAAHRGHSR